MMSGRDEKHVESLSRFMASMCVYDYCNIEIFRPEFMLSSNSKEWLAADCIVAFFEFVRPESLALLGEW